MNFRNILVPVDFSEFSDYAVEYALFLAEKCGARLTLLHVVTMFQGEGKKKEQLREYEKLVKAKEKEGFNNLKAFNKSAEMRGVSVDSKIARDITEFQAILEFIDKNDVDLVVMGTHGRTGFKKWVYGSVTEKIVRLCPIPVLTTQQPLKKFAIERILAPVDFSDYSKGAVDSAMSMAKQFQSQLEFLHVIVDPIPLGYYEAGLEGLYTADTEIKERSLEKLKEFVGKTESNYTYTIVDGAPYQETTEHARREQTDLIIMATRGNSGLKHFLVGSTTERVVPLAPCPVLTVERNR